MCISLPLLQIHGSITKSIWLINLTIKSISKPIGPAMKVLWKAL